MIPYDQARGDQLVEHFAALGAPLKEIADALRTTEAGVVGNHAEALRRGRERSNENAVHAMWAMMAQGRDR